MDAFKEFEAAFLKAQRAAIRKTAEHFAHEFKQSAFKGRERHLHEEIRDLRSRLAKSCDEERRHQALRDVLQVFEAAGIKSKFGGVLDIDFDRFIECLDQPSRDELLRVLKDHIQEEDGKLKLVR